MQGAVINVGSLPASGNTQGDAYINQTDDSLWIWNGTQWISGGSIQGPQGIQGVAGSTGADSTVAGPQGIQGLVGPQGNVGVKGDVGTPGAKGDVGAKGDQGDAGTPGTDGADSTVAGPQGIQGITGEQGVQGDTGVQGITGAAGADGADGAAGADGDDGADGSGGGKKYLVRLEYDVNEALITANTVFVSATGFETSGASIISQTAGSGNSNHDVTLNFSDTNPPTSIIGYGWNPATGNYTAAHYDRDTKQVQYEVGMGAFTHQATTDGASGADGQWGGASFSGAGSYNIKLVVDQSALSYGNAVPGAFTNPSKLPHAYLILSF